MKAKKIGIVGAGLAGLSLSIQLAKAGHEVVLFEKYAFPFHKLCGEYLSRESLSFLTSLGLDMTKIKPAQIDALEITNTSGKRVSADLPLGGVGVSRWKMDFELYEIAKSYGVKILEKAQVIRIENIDLKKKIVSKKGEHVYDLVVSSYGKKSNLAKSTGQNDYIGVKYHVKNKNHPEHLISMHNFKGGYCGVSRVEGDWVSLCYLSEVENLKQCDNKIGQLEEQVLFQNVAIKKIFDESEKVYERPLVVSNINFHKKDLIQEGIFHVGDSAGLITPLCGNGMSMALHGSYILGKLLEDYLEDRMSRKDLERLYQQKWDKTFKRRMRAGRFIQKVFRKEQNADLAMRLMNASNLIKSNVIRMTHGKEFYQLG